MLLEHDRRNYNDLRNMMNIWRERLPHKCETIQTWQDVLENRRYIFSLLFNKIHRQQQARAQQQVPSGGAAGGIQNGSGAPTPGSADQSSSQNRN